MSGTTSFHSRLRTGSLALFLVLALLALGLTRTFTPPVLAAGTTFTVTTAADNTTTDGTCTLREAILAANGAPANADCGADSGAPYTIAFNIGGGGAQTITPGSALPFLTRAATIDGATQPSCSNYPCILLNGSSAGSGANGLVLDSGSDGSLVQGLVINRFAGNGITILSGNNRISANYIGTTADGTAAAGNTGAGVMIGNGSVSAVGNVVGTDGNGSGDSAEGNVISGNG